MAELVTRLKVDSSEFDSKIQRATKGLQAYQDKCRDVGGTLEYVEKEELDFVRALGQMDTVARTSKGKLNELKQSFVELSVQYKNLTQAEQNSPFGRALAGSIDQLRGRIQTLNGQVQESERSLGGSGGGLGEAAQTLGGKLGLPIQAFSKLGMGMAAAGAAAAVAKNAFQQNEELMDGWQRTVAASQSVWQAFGVALNTGDFSGFFKHIGNIIQSARDAYDALDALSTFNAFNQANVEKARAEFTAGIVDYREGKISKEELQTRADNWNAQLESRQGFEQKAYDDRIKQLATKYDVDFQQLKDILTGSYEDYETAKDVMPRTKTKIMFGMGGEELHVEEAIGKSLWTDKERLGEALRMITDKELGEVQSLGAAVQRTGREKKEVDKQVLRYTGTNVPKAAASSTTATPAAKDTQYGTNSIGFIDEQLRKAREELVAATTDAERAAIQERIAMLSTQKDLLEGKTTLAPLTPTLVEDASDILAAEIEAMNAELPNIRLNIETEGDPVQTATDTKEAWSAVGSAISSVSGAISSIEDPGAKIAGTIGQAVATIALAYAQASASPAVAGTGWGWLAFAATGLATLITTISTIKSVAGSYADGGIIPGNSPSGDLLTANVNSGELILNRAQQANIASQLAGSSAIGNLTLTSVVRGEDIRLALSNNSRRRGGARGEYAINTATR